MVPTKLIYMCDYTLYCHSYASSLNVIIPEESIWIFFGLTLTPQMVIFGFKFCKMVTSISWFLNSFLYSVLFGGTSNLEVFILCYVSESNRILDAVPRERLCKEVVAMLYKISNKLIKTYQSELFEFS